MKFSANPVTAAQNRYKNIYGTDRNRGTVPYSCVIYVSDNAKEYINSSEDSNESEGNKTAVSYLYNDVYESLMSANSGYDLSAADLMTIINGTYVASDDSRYDDNADVVKGSLSSDELAEVKSKLVGSSSVQTDSSINHLKFSLNPAVNPTYTVSGLSLEDSPNGTKNQTVTFIVSPGLDAALIKPATVKIWLMNCGELGKSGFDESKYADFIADPAKFEGESGVRLVRDFVAESYDETPVSSFTESFKIPDVVANNYYVIAISVLRRRFHSHLPQIRRFC